jgi:hypothetical protein
MQPCALSMSSLLRGRGFTGIDTRDDADIAYFFGNKMTGFMIHVLAGIRRGSRLAEAARFVTRNIVHRFWRRRPLAPRLRVRHLIS